MAITVDRSRKARNLLARAVIFVHGGTSEGRIAAIARYGAEMVHVEGNDDDSVSEAARVAEHEGWTVLSDTSWPGYEHIPGFIIQGYTLMVREALQQIPGPDARLHPGRRRWRGRRHRRASLSGDGRQASLGHGGGAGAGGLRLRERQGGTDLHRGGKRPP